MKSRPRTRAACRAFAILLLSLAPPWLSLAAAQGAAARPAASTASAAAAKGGTVKNAKSQGKTAQPAGKPTKQYTYTITGGC